MLWVVVKLRLSALFVVVGLALCGAVILTGFPDRIVEAVTSRRMLPVYSVETDKKIASLGINCAWGDEDIGSLLATLAEKDVKASFFVTGTFCRKFPAAVKAIYDAGHEIGSHSNTHVDLAALGRDAILEQIRKGNAEINAITGQIPYLFRTPSGSYSSLAIETIRAEGMLPVQWDCDSLDYKNPTPWDMKARVLERIKPGSITLFHAGTKNTAAAMPGIIDALREAGYELIPVGELVYPEPYHLDHEGRQYKGS